MADIRRFIKKYFSFKRRERNGLILLSTVIVILIFSLIWIKSQRSEFQVSFTPLTVASFLPNETAVTKTDSGEKSEGKKAAGSFFTFDPNTLTKSQAQQLGFPDKVFKVLENYRSKGGKFKSSADLKKIYGITDEFFNKLEPYILIESENKNSVAENKMNITAPPPQVNSKKIIDINSADSVQLVSLNGIGPTLCRRILIFRNMLGGFAYKEQIKEVYGMRDSLYQLFSERITADAAGIKKININTAGVDELKKHAYIKFIVAQSIVNYRAKHGRYSSEADLLKVGSLTEETIKKLSPYLEF